jgi:hypothetical protein
MRFMVIIKANKDSEAGAQLKWELIEPMIKFNEEMVKAGVMLAAEGLQPSSRGARIRFDHGKRTVTDGPFAETKELVGGFWILQVKSKEEAIEWMKRCPAPFGDDEVTEIEIRQVYEMSDLPAEDARTADAVAREQRMHDDLAAQTAKQN